VLGLGGAFIRFQRNDPTPWPLPPRACRIPFWTQVGGRIAWLIGGISAPKRRSMSEFSAIVNTCFTFAFRSVKFYYYISSRGPIRLRFHVHKYLPLSGKRFHAFESLITNFSGVISHESVPSWSDKSSIGLLSRFLAY
jgi:hypothetical protein